MPAAIPIIMAATSAAGSIAASRAKGRADEASVNQNQDKVALDSAAQEQDARNKSVQLDLDQRKYADDSNTLAANNAVKGGYLQGVQDINIDVPDGLKPYMAHITGGMRPSAITGKDQIGQLMQQSALSQLMNPLQPGGINDLSQGGTAQARGSRTGGASVSDPGQSDIIAQTMNRLPGIGLVGTPKPTALPEPGLLDKILGNASMVGALAGPAASAYANNGNGRGGGGSTAPDPNSIGRGIRF